MTSSRIHCSILMLVVNLSKGKSDHIIHGKLPTRTVVHVHLQHKFEVLRRASHADALYSAAHVQQPTGNINASCNTDEKSSQMFI